MKETIKIGYDGLGRRGMRMLDICFSEMRDVEVSILCDVDGEKLREGSALLEKKQNPRLGSPRITAIF